ncbi:unnamed protein product [Ixodes persulcatus]
MAMVSTSDTWDASDFLVLDESMSYVHPKEVSMWGDNMKSWPPIGKCTWCTQRPANFRRSERTRALSCIST